MKIGNDIKISGAVSMDDAGNLTAIGDFQSGRLAFADFSLEKLLFRIE